MSVVSKEELIAKYTDKLVHKATQELTEKLPEEGFFSEMVNEADHIMLEMFKANKGG